MVKYRVMIPRPRNCFFDFFKMTCMANKKVLFGRDSGQLKIPQIERTLSPKVYQTGWSVKNPVLIPIRKNPVVNPAIKRQL